MDEPTSFRAGDSAAWTATLQDYPASAGWTLSYRLLSQAGVAQDIETTPVGDDYHVSLTTADTAAWPAGNATLVKIVSKGSERITLGAPVVAILPNLATAPTYDGRTQNEKGLADAEAALAAYVAAGQMHVEGYEVAGRTMKFRTVQDIKDLIAHYRVAVMRDRTAQALLNGDQPPGRCYYRG